jgi:hypothetical protein
MANVKAGGWRLAAGGWRLAQEKKAGGWRLSVFNCRLSTVDCRLYSGWRESPRCTSTFTETETETETISDRDSVSLPRIHRCAAAHPARSGTRLW